MSPRPAFALGGEQVAAGERRTIGLPVSTLSDHTPVNLAVHVVHGRRDGPVVFVSAAVHGDEVIGVEVVRRLLRAPQLDRLRGTLLVVPIVNAFGFLNRSRYLPDRRDLNRCFPGTPRGSLASRLAHLFLTEVVGRATLGIDLHSAAIHRTNLPQVRVSPGSERTLALAQAFGAPVVVTSRLREGSLREAAARRGVDVLLYEAGEGLRFDEAAARTGVMGVLRVLREVGMLAGRGVAPPKAPSVVAASSGWVRAPSGGLLRAHRGLGDMVAAGDALGTISDPFGTHDDVVVAPVGGIVIGRTEMPVVNEGDGLFHVAQPGRPEDAADRLDALRHDPAAADLLDEDEII